MSLTNEQKKAYLENPNLCPKCQGYIQHIDEDAYDANYVWRGWKCESCKFSYTESYKLVDIEENETDEDEGEEYVGTNIES